MPLRLVLQTPLTHFYAYLKKKIQANKKRKKFLSLPSMTWLFFPFLNFYRKILFSWMFRALRQYIYHLCCLWGLVCKCIGQQGSSLEQRTQIYLRSIKGLTVIYLLLVTGQPIDCLLGCLGLGIISVSFG